MLSPVSPSATGNTLRSLTSSLRASSAASPASSTERKRTIDGSDSGLRSRVDGGSDTGLLSRVDGITPLRPGSLERLGYLPGLQAARAHVYAPGRPGVVDPHALEVRIEPSLRGHHRVAAAVTERRRATTHMTHLGHGGRVYPPRLNSHLVA